jgi:hypothetical protein
VTTSFSEGMFGDAAFDSSSRPTTRRPAIGISGAASGRQNST